MAVSQHIWHCGAGLPGDVLIADLRAYRYAPHFHDAWSIGAVEQGRCDFTVQGESHAANAGDLVVIAPGQVHTGGTSAGPLAYRMAYIDPAWFQDHERALYAQGARFAGPVIADPGLCGRWLEALAPEDIPPARGRERISAALFGLLAAHAKAREAMPADESASESADMDDVCALLRQRMAADPACAPDLETLAQAQDRHRTTLVKQFARRYGLPPQAWLRNWRVARARALLRAGLPLADAAQAVGFADQAHLTRVFKQIYGSTPGVLARADASDSQTVRLRGVSIR
ncbi:helix-turn-helix transcriptional regulator [Achromobacter arsenitoxydans]|uniref:AraC family transcriptional regulator n=1 Tax=Achromobacter arsenitoxydans SY8 TaxID=477184 RepID=H0F5N2_9BURK|nr:AraC family transcriptional regulator [Achromobacter arsenitoxydans]EHK66546.1 AraC family transcriptional regulator [Achromobacter arsenitoxydans SY8]